MQHDVTPPHATREVTALPNDFDDCWLRRGGPISWLPGSPDLSPLDFFVWGCMKSMAYLNGKPDAREQLMKRINEAAVGIRNELVSMQLMESYECVL
jgi:agmatine/peptidylarginine deiminase